MKIKYQKLNEVCVNGKVGNFKYLVNKEDRSQINFSIRNER